MSTIDPHDSLAELVLAEPGRAELFEQLGFDFCCHGRRSLARACAERGLDPGTAVRLLEAYEAANPARAHHFDPASASTAQLCDHIVEAHHARLRQELPRLSETLATVVRVHGPDDPRLPELAAVFRGLARDLLAHLTREEELLFPACRSLEDGVEPADREALLAELEHDHADVGETLPRLRELAGGYDPAHARCGTHRALLDGLGALERDLHQHVHEENNVLFPRVRSRLAA